MSSSWGVSGRKGKGLALFLDGGLGGFNAGLIVQPLQVIKTAFQIKPYSHTKDKLVVGSPEHPSIRQIVRLIW